MKHGEYWIRVPGQNVEGLHTSMGKSEPTGLYRHPLNTVESDEPKVEGKPWPCFPSVRYFIATKDIPKEIAQKKAKKDN